MRQRGLPRNEHPLPLAHFRDDEVLSFLTLGVVSVEAGMVALVQALALFPLAETFRRGSESAAGMPAPGMAWFLQFPTHP